MHRIYRFLLLALGLFACMVCLRGGPTPLFGAVPATSIPVSYVPIRFHDGAGSVPAWWPHIMPRTEDPLMLGWEYRPKTLEAVPPAIDIFAPTWLYVEINDDTGLPQLYTVQELGRTTDFAGYIDTAHQAGARVWVTAVSFTPEVTDALIHTPDCVDAFIDKLIAACREWGADGVNLDFENMNPDHAADYNAFAALCAERLHEEGLLISADVTVPLENPDPDNWWQCYDRAGLAQVVDYVAVMTYDQHISSQDPGPVGGLDWVEDKLRATLAEIPSDKLLLGVPFYGRDFQVLSDGSTRTASVYPSEVQAVLNDGRYTKGGEEIAVAEWRVKNEREKGSMVNRLEYLDTNGTLHRIWYEDEVSLAARAALADKYHLAGVAAWQMSFGQDSYWTALASELNR